MKKSGDVARKAPKKSDRIDERKRIKYAKAAKTSKGRKMLRKRGVDLASVQPKEEEDFGDFDGVDFDAIEKEMKQVRD